MLILEPSLATDLSEKHLHRNEVHAVAPFRGWALTVSGRRAAAASHVTHRGGSIKHEGREVPQRLQILAQRGVKIRLGSKRHLERHVVTNHRRVALRGR